MFTKAFIPYGGYFSSPFVRWQGSLSAVHSLPLAGATAKRWLGEKQWDPGMFDYVNFGCTVAQPHIFFGGPWAAALIGCEGVPGVWISQACSTSTTCVYQAAMAVEVGSAGAVFNLMADRTSNGPHTIWPNPNGPGALVDTENWVQDNFSCDPWAGEAMIQTAENVAAQSGLTREECDAVSLRRYQQYMDGMADERAFQKRYMFPLEVAVSRKKTVTIEADEGIFPTTAEGLAGLKPVLPGGVLTYGAQTHPADGNAAVAVTTRDTARELSPSGPEIQILSFGYSRVGKALMPSAPVPAAEMALERAGLSVADMKAIKTHNPFVANDLYMAKTMGLDVMSLNNYGSPLVYGHPQGPTAARCVMELIEELVLLGGGHGLFTGCAAGDTAGALVIKVG
ncbi:MAG: thiolase family protein [Thermoleophilia bacterium]|nr:thiolase family protein [Thermoleophilia bacterium]